MTHPIVENVKKTMAICSVGTWTVRSSFVLIVETNALIVEGLFVMNVVMKDQLFV